MTSAATNTTIKTHNAMNRCRRSSVESDESPIEESVVAGSGVVEGPIVSHPRRAEGGVGEVFPSLTEHIPALSYFDRFGNPARHHESEACPGLANDAGCAHEGSRDGGRDPSCCCDCVQLLACTSSNMMCRNGWSCPFPSSNCVGTGLGNGPSEPSATGGMIKCACQEPSGSTPSLKTRL